MHIITQKRIWEAQKHYPESASALEGWYRIIKNNTFKNYAELKKCFNAIDKVGEQYVFDIGGNKLRLIAYIHFNRGKVYITHILSHKEYDKNQWKRGT